MQHIKLYHLSLFFLTLPLVCNAEDLSCQAIKFEDYSQVKIAYQIKLTQLIESRHPELGPIARIYMNDQLMLIEKKRIEFRVLKANNPLLLNTNKRLNEWVNPSDDKQREIAASHPLYAELVDKIEVIKQRPIDPDGDKLRQVMRENIMSTEAFLNITRELTQKTETLNKTKCL